MLIIIRWCIFKMLIKNATFIFFILTDLLIVCVYVFSRDINCDYFTYDANALKI